MHAYIHAYIFIFSDYIHGPPEPFDFKHVEHNQNVFVGTRAKPLLEVPYTTYVYVICVSCILCVYIYMYIYIIIYTFVEPVFLHLPLMFLSLPRQHGLELSLVQEAEGSEENEERVCCSRGTLLRGRMGYIGILILRAIQAGWKDPIKCRLLMICK